MAALDFRMTRLRDYEKKITRGVIDSQELGSCFVVRQLFQPENKDSRFF